MTLARLKQYRLDVSIYFFGPDPGRVVSVHDSHADACHLRDRNGSPLIHKHVMMKFGENPAKGIEGSTICACDFQLKADGGWAEIEETIAKAPVTPGKLPKAIISKNLPTCCAMARSGRKAHSKTCEHYPLKKAARSK